MTNTRILFAALLASLLPCCKDSEQNYQYVITNKTSRTDPINVTYHIEGKNSDTEIELEPGDSIVIANRNEVPGKGVWDIETSINLYKIPSLYASNTDQSVITEELSFRKLWNGPTDINNTGVYQLDIRDEHFVLSKQYNYTYVIKNGLKDTIFSTSHLKRLTGENTTRSADTILKGEEKVIGSVDIYTYAEEMAGLKKYKEKKMSGLSTIFFLFKGERVELNLAKDTLFFNAGKDTCTLVITEEMPKIQDIITPKKDKK